MSRGLEEMYKMTNRHKVLTIKAHGSTNRPEMRSVQLSYEDKSQKERRLSNVLG